MNSETPHPQPDDSAWIVPPGDGQRLVDPPFDALARLVEHNRRERTERHVTLLGEDITLIDPALRQSPPIILSGHQVEFIHPGVWFKNVVATRLAERLGGRATFWAVDNDVCDDVELRWPEKAGARWITRRWKPFEANRGLVVAAAVASHEQWAAGVDQVPERLRRGSDGVWDAFETAFLDRAQRTGRAGFVDCWSDGLAAVDRTIGVPTAGLFRTSELAEGDLAETWARFVAHCIEHARHVAAAYNRALGDYRQRNGIVGDRHPIPDLRIEADRVELPFWVIPASGQRSRLGIRFAHANGIELLADDRAMMACSRSELNGNPRGLLCSPEKTGAIWPRALTLTLFARLFACDLFIHGLGGAKYDRITDAFSRHLFGFAPPPYACATATLRLPLDGDDASEADLRVLRRQLREMRYNPERYTAADAADAERARLVQAKSDAVQTASRLAREAPSDRRARRAAFDRIHELNRTLYDRIPGRESLLRRLEALERRLEDQRTTASREWFVALFPVRKLQALAEFLG